MDFFVFLFFMLVPFPFMIISLRDSIGGNTVYRTIFYVLAATLFFLSAMIIISADGVVLSTATTLYNEPMINSTAVPVLLPPTVVTHTVDIDLHDVSIGTQPFTNPTFWNNYYSTDTVCMKSERYVLTYFTGYIFTTPYPDPPLGVCDSDLVVSAGQSYEVLFYGTNLNQDIDTNGTITFQYRMSSNDNNIGTLDISTESLEDFNPNHQRLVTWNTNWTNSHIWYDASIEFAYLNSTGTLQFHLYFDTAVTYNTAFLSLRDMTVTYNELVPTPPPAPPSREHIQTELVNVYLVTSDQYGVHLIISSIYILLGLLFVVFSLIEAFSTLANGLRPVKI